MKVAITSSYVYGGKTGAAVVTEELMKRLSQDVEVLFVCLGDKYERYKEHKNLEIIKLPSTEIKGYDAPSIWTSDHQRLKDDLKDFAPDIIHAQNVLFVDLLVSIWGINNGVKVIATFHLLPSDVLYYFVPKLKSRTVGKLISYPYSNIHTKKLLENIDAAIALNQEVRRSLTEITTKTKIYTLNNGLSLEGFLNLKVKEQQEKKKFIYLGSYAPRKNQLYLVKAFSNLPNSYELHLYGEIKTGESYVKKIRKYLEKNKINNVFVHDYVDREKVKEIYENSDFLVSASSKEAQSLVIIESMAAATPVIGLSNETMDEIINTSNGLVLEKKTTPLEFAERLKNFVENSVYSDLCKNARERSSQFDIEIVIKKMIAIYEEVINSKKAEKEKKNGIFSTLLPGFNSQSEIEKNKPRYIRAASAIMLTLTTALVFLKLFPKNKQSK